MKCQNCGEHDANFKYTEIVNGVKKEMSLCDICATKLGIADVHFNIPINFSSFFGDLLNEYEESTFMPLLNNPKQLKCADCGMTYDEFMNTGMFGCSHCYDAFSDKIEPVLKRLHGSTNYIGRKAVKTDMKIQDEVKTDDSEIVNLKQELKQAIKEENYEKAATLRDRIKELEGGQK